jgi:TetR/AcrR family transcriptional repressor of nem operon
MMRMRYAEDHKQATRARVLKAASRVIRQNGPDRVAVAGVMAEVGLTHGGFYAHFESKDDLLAQAIGQMFVDSSDNFSNLTADRPPLEALKRYFDFYLSTDHRDRRDRGCPLPALAADLPRLPTASREIYGRGVAGLADRLADRMAAAGCENPEVLARSVLSELVGAVALARAVSDRDQSEAILNASRESIRARVGA